MRDWNIAIFVYEKQLNIGILIVPPKIKVRNINCPQEIYPQIAHKIQEGK